MLGKVGSGRALKVASQGTTSAFRIHFFCVSSLRPFGDLWWLWFLSRNWYFLPPFLPEQTQINCKRRHSHWAWSHRETLDVLVEDKLGGSLSHSPWVRRRPVQRSRCQGWVWRLKVGQMMSPGLYLVFSPQRTLDGELTVGFCQESGFTTRRGWDEEEKRGGGEDPVTAAWGQICLLGEVNWLGGKVERGARRKTGGGGKGEEARVCYWSCDCSCHNLRYARAPFIAP